MRKGNAKIILVTHPNSISTDLIRYRTGRKSAASSTERFCLFYFTCFSRYYIAHILCCSSCHPAPGNTQWYCTHRLSLSGCAWQNVYFTLMMGQKKDQINQDHPQCTVYVEPQNSQLAFGWILWSSYYNLNNGRTCHRIKVTQKLAQISGNIYENGRNVHVKTHTILVCPVLTVSWC